MEVHGANLHVDICTCKQVVGSVRSLWLVVEWFRTVTPDRAMAEYRCQTVEKSLWSTALNRAYGCDTIETRAFFYDYVTLFDRLAVILLHSI